MYQHGVQWKRFYLAVYEGFDLREWIFIFLGAGISWTLYSKVIHCELRAGPFLLTIKV